uniref:Uncharacterized protein n=1 Tax=Lepeophtheirus salmonis TaxID=72036 RepID=A0A0K2UAL8_LEPSM
MAQSKNSEILSKKLHQIDSNFEDFVNAYGSITIEEKKIKETKAPSSRSKSRKRNGSKFRRPRNETQENDTSSGKSPRCSKELNESDSKECIKNWTREWIWYFMENNDSSLYIFPRPILGKIPNFLYSKDAARLLTRLKEFKDASIIKVDSSMSLMPLRELVLQNKEFLYSNVRNLVRRDFLYCINSIDLKNKRDFAIASTKKGLITYGKPIRIGLKSLIRKIDIFVVGSVAVCRNGVRLGTGKGIIDIEWGILYDAGAVDEKTIVVTVVADDQVVGDDVLPSWVQNEHDLPVDIIITPTKVLKVVPKLKKPCCGILVNLLTDEMKETIPSLKFYDF